jgi:hypothetical protein
MTKENAKAWILRIILGAFALICFSKAPEHLGIPQAWAELLKGVGEAILVAIVLEFLVDKRVKEHFGEDIVREVAPRILARLLPPTVFQYIEEKLLRAELFRKVWHIEYELTVLSKDSDYVELKTVSEYEMENRAATPVVYKAVYEVEQALVSGFGDTEITKVRVYTMPHRDVVFESPNSSKKKEDNPYIDGNYVVFRRPFEIPVRTDNLPAVGFMFKSTEHFRIGSIVPFFATYPVETASFKVVYPKNELKVIVDFPANDVSQLTPTSTSHDRDVYEFPKPILPGQGFTVRFSRI